LGVSPPTGIDDREEFAPVLVIFGLRELVAELLQVRGRYKRTHEIHDDLGVIGSIRSICTLYLADP
jgi:hypothetical protein